MVKVQNRKRTNVLMFFRVKEPEVPVEQLELKEDIISVSWEPSGDRLSIVYGEPRQPTIAFYSMVKTVTVDPKANKIPGMATNKKDTVKKKQVHELTLLHTITGKYSYALLSLLSLLLLAYTDLLCLLSLTIYSSSPPPSLLHYDAIYHHRLSSI